MNPAPTTKVTKCQAIAKRWWATSTIYVAAMVVINQCALFFLGADSLKTTIVTLLYVAMALITQRLLFSWKLYPQGKPFRNVGLDRRYATILGISMLENTPDIPLHKSLHQNPRFERYTLLCGLMFVLLAAGELFLYGSTDFVSPLHLLVWVPLALSVGPRFLWIALATSGIHLWYATHLSYGSSSPWTLAGGLLAVGQALFFAKMQSDLQTQARAQTLKASNHRSFSALGWIWFVFLSTAIAAFLLAPGLDMDSFRLNPNQVNPQGVSSTQELAENSKSSNGTGIDADFPRPGRLLDGVDLDLSQLPNLGSSPSSSDENPAAETGSGTSGLSMGTGQESPSPPQERGSEVDRRVPGSAGTASSQWPGASGATPNKQNANAGMETSTSVATSSSTSTDHPARPSSTGDGGSHSARSTESMGSPGADHSGARSTNSDSSDSLLSAMSDLTKEWQEDSIVKWVTALIALLVLVILVFGLVKLIRFLKGIFRKDHQENTAGEQHGKPATKLREKGRFRKAFNEIVALPTTTERERQIVTVELYNLLVDSAAETGFGRSKDQTPDEYQLELLTSSGKARASIRAVTSTFCQTLYGKSAPELEMLIRYQSHILKVAKGLKLP